MKNSEQSAQSTSRRRRRPSEGFRRSARRPVRNSFSDIRLALADLGRTVRAANRDVALSYQRTLLGPFWITITTIVFVSGYTVVGLYIFKQNIAEYLPFLVSGVVLWQYIASSLNGSIGIFNGQASLLTAARIPVFSLFLRFAIRVIVQVAHSLPVPFVISAFLIGTDVNWLQALLGLAIVFFTVSCLCLLIGTLSVWAHDLGVIVANLTQFMFYVSPVMWPPGPVLESNGWWVVAFNPFHHLLRVFRDPMIGQSLSAEDYRVVLGLAFTALVVSLWAFFRLRRKIAYAI